MKELLDEKLLDHSSTVSKRMFGCQAYYVHGRLMLVSANSGKEPWNGLLIAMERENHEELQKRFPELKPHKVLKKWLYISQKNPEIESVTLNLISLVLKNDKMIGLQA